MEIDGGKVNFTIEWKDMPADTFLRLEWVAKKLNLHDVSALLQYLVIKAIDDHCKEE